MKKLVLFAVALVAISFASCKKAASDAAAAGDSTTTKVDSTAPATVDSASAKVDSAKVDSVAK